MAYRAYTARDVIIITLAFMNMYLIKIRLTPAADNQVQFVQA